MSMSPNSGKYAYFAGGYADDHSGPALGVADSLKPETRNLPSERLFERGLSRVLSAIEANHLPQASIISGVGVS